MNVSESETSYTQKNQERENILGEYEPFVALDESSNIILPITAEFSDVDSQINYNEQDEDVLGSIEYTYAGRLVGSADITATDVEVNTFDFHEQEEEKTETAAINASDSAEGTTNQKAGQNRIFQIEPKMIAAGVAGIGILGLFILLVWKFVDNFYKIRHMLHMDKREKSPYTTIKQNKMFRKRRKRWF